MPCGLTCLLAGEGKNNDVIKGPGVVRVRRVEGQVPGCRLPQVDQEGRVHHGDCKAAPAFPLADGDVGRRALVVALWGVEAEFCVGSLTGRLGTRTMGGPEHLESKTRCQLLAAVGIP